MTKDHPILEHPLFLGVWLILNLVVLTIALFSHAYPAVYIIVLGGNLLFYFYQAKMEFKEPLVLPSGNDWRFNGLFRLVLMAAFVLLIIALLETFIFNWQDRRPWEVWIYIMAMGLSAYIPLMFSQMVWKNKLEDVD